MPTRAPKYWESVGFKSLFYFCSLPLRLDSYRGCTHGCLYCFSQSLNNRPHGFHRDAVPADPDRFIRLLKSRSNEARPRSVIASCLGHGVPVHFGCTSDPLQPKERKARVSLTLLRALRAERYPFVLSTKSNMVTDPRYLQLLRGSAASVQISFSTLSDKLARVLEPGAPPPSKRLRAMALLSAHGVYTVARLQPFLYPRERDIEGTCRAFAQAGCRHIVLEHLRVPTNSRICARLGLWRALGMDLLEEYRRLGMQRSRVSYELASEAKLENILKAKRVANSLGMTFGSGDNDFHHVSDGLCCCGVPDTPEFENIYTGHLGRGAMAAVQRGTVWFDYLDEVWHPEGNIRRYMNSHCRPERFEDVAAALRSRVADPSASNSPLLFHGIRTCGDGTYAIDPGLRAMLIRSRSDERRWRD